MQLLKCHSLKDNDHHSLLLLATTNSEKYNFYVPYTLQHHTDNKSLINTKCLVKIRKWDKKGLKQAVRTEVASTMDT